MSPSLYTDLIAMDIKPIIFMSSVNLIKTINSKVIMSIKGIKKWSEDTQGYFNKTKHIFTYLE